MAEMPEYLPALLAPARLVSVHHSFQVIQKMVQAEKETVMAERLLLQDQGVNWILRPILFTLLCII